MTRLMDQFDDVWEKFEGIMDRYFDALPEPTEGLPEQEQVSHLRQAVNIAVDQLTPEETKELILALLVHSIEETL